MTAAYELGLRGYDCQILEARPFAGGRCQSSRAGFTTTTIEGEKRTCDFDDGQYFNHGPWRLPSFHHAVFHYIRKFGIPMEIMVQENDLGYVQFNNAVGYAALNDNTTGQENTAVGKDTLANNTTANNNTALGYDALKLNTTGSRNIALGDGALDAPDTENDNLAIGYDALGGTINGGEFNLAIGNYSLDANTSGDYNVAVVFIVLMFGMIHFIF